MVTAFAILAMFSSNLQCVSPVSRCSGSGQCVWEVPVWLRKVPVFPLRLEGRLLYWKPRPDFLNLLRKHCMQLYITDMRCRNCWLKYSQIERKPNVVMELGHRPRQMFQLGDPAFGCLRGRESPWMTILFFQQAGLLCRRNFLAESRLQLTLG